MQLPSYDHDFCSLEPLAPLVSIAAAEANAGLCEITQMLGILQGDPDIGAVAFYRKKTGSDDGRTKSSTVAFRYLDRGLREFSLLNKSAVSATLADPLEIARPAQDLQAILWHLDDTRLDRLLVTPSVMIAEEDKRGQRNDYALTRLNRLAPADFGALTLSEDLAGVLRDSIVENGISHLMTGPGVDAPSDATEELPLTQAWQQESPAALKEVQRLMTARDRQDPVFALIAEAVGDLIVVSRVVVDAEWETCREIAGIATHKA